MRINYPKEQTIYNGFIAMTLLNQHHSKCVKHATYWAKQIELSNEVFINFREFSKILLFGGKSDE